MTLPNNPNVVVFAITLNHGTSSSTTAVNMSGSFNVNAMFVNNSNLTNGGFDTSSYA